MNLDQLNKWLALAANLGVIAGIVFLGIEIQQNTRILQAAAIQESTNVAREQILMFVKDAEVNRIRMIGSEDLSQLTTEEQNRYFWINRSGVLGVQSLYRQWQLGVLPDEEWEVWSKIICGNAEGHTFQELWTGNAAILIPAFVEFVESCDASQAANGALPPSDPPT